MLSPSSPKDTLLIGSLDSTVRLMDRSNGQMLASFGSSPSSTPSATTSTTTTTTSPEFKNTLYRSQVAFGHGESVVLAGDETGRLWAWDIVSGRPLSNIPKIHEKVITWIEHHPEKDDEMLTASADGTVKIWTNKQ